MISGLKTNASFNVDNSSMTTKTQQKSFKNSLANAFRRKLDRPKIMNIKDFENSDLPSSAELSGMVDLVDSTLGSNNVSSGFNKTRLPVQLLPPTMRSEESISSMKIKR